MSLDSELFNGSWEPVSGLALYLLGVAILTAPLLALMLDMTMFILLDLLR